MPWHGRCHCANPFCEDASHFCVAQPPNRSADEHGVCVLLAQGRRGQQRRCLSSALERAAERTGATSSSPLLSWRSFKRGANSFTSSWDTLSDELDDSSAFMRAGSELACSDAARSGARLRVVRVGGPAGGHGSGLRQRGLSDRAERAWGLREAGAATLFPCAALCAVGLGQGCACFPAGF